LIQNHFRICWGALSWRSHPVGTQQLKPKALLATFRIARTVAEMNRGSIRGGSEKMKTMELP
jgi:hypothetical protein